MKKCSRHPRTGVPLWSIVILVSIWICLPVDLLPVRAEEPLERNESIAIGSGPISGGNLASAKKVAISRALERGVEQYLVRKLGSRVMTVGFQRVIREVLPAGEELVENFQVLAEEPTGDRYHVLVRMRINEEIMEETLRDAGLSKAEMVPAKVLFMVSETVGEDITHWWENPASHSSLAPTEVALYQAFQERGLAPINRTMSLPSGDFSGYAAVPELELDQIVAWGRLFSADMVLYGFSQIQQEDITLMLSAVDVQKGDIVGDSTRIIGLPSPATETQILESLEILADQMASKLAPVIRQAAARSQGGLSELAVLLRGLTSYSQFRILQDFLSREVQGVQSVRQTRVRRDSISIAVEFQGNRDMFLNRVLNHERLPLPLRVEPSAEDQIVLVVESQVLPGRSPQGR